MYLRKICLQNAGPFEHFEHTFIAEEGEPLWTPLVGANGSGKTLLLKSIALLSLSPALINCTRTAPTAFRGRDLTKPAELYAEWEIPGHPIITSRATLQPSGSLFDAQTDDGQLPDRLLEIQNGQGLADQAFLATYHQDRYCAYPLPKNKINFSHQEKLGTRSLLDSETPLGLALWPTLSKKQLIFFRAQIRHILSTLSMEELKDLILQDVISVGRAGVYRDSVLTAHDVKLPVTLLGHGYQSLITLFSDLLCRLILAQPRVKSLADYQGTVLIDDIEIGLHICLQRTLTQHLHRLFPRIHFIYTTHSPSMLDQIDRDKIICL